MISPGTYAVQNRIVCWLRDQQGEILGGNVPCVGDMIRVYPEFRDAEIGGKEQLCDTDVATACYIHEADLEIMLDATEDK